MEQPNGTVTEGDTPDASPMTSSTTSFTSTSTDTRTPAAAGSSRASVQSARTTLVDGNMAPGWQGSEDAAPLVLERFYLWETASVRPRFIPLGLDH